MARLIPCPSCRSHVLVSEQGCPHCGATLRTTVNPSVPAVLMGLAMTGCIIQAEPAYGVPDPTTDTGSETATDTGNDEASTSGDTTTGDTTGDTTDTGGEPEYGVPDTGLDTGTDTGTDT
ncbi:MAG: hypothetical protein KC431_07655, partial [Myxococcales bacterium]|nr:hypothetical protein [Myxococcales bacterium]